jgi:hypothetical protein
MSFLGLPESALALSALTFDMKEFTEAAQEDFLLKTLSLTVLDGSIFSSIFTLRILDLT